MEVNEFLSWELAGTVAGAATIVWLVVSILKGVVGTYWTDVVNRVVTIVLSIALMAYMVYRGEDATVDNYVLAVLNGFVVSLAVSQFSSVTNNVLSRGVFRAVRKDV